MALVHAEATEVIEARPEDVYAVLSDYRVGHPAVLPRPYFTELTVEQGGRGAGTVVRVGVRAFGQERSFRMVVSEPEPGRVLVETDADAGVVTTFTVEPVDGGRRSRVTIATDSRPSAGLAGLIERWVAPAASRGIYRKELRQLAEYLQRQAPPMAA